MSGTVVPLRPAAAPAPASSDGAPAAVAPVGRRFTDRHAAALLALAFALLVALTWRKWGAPEADAGAEMTAADAIAHGAKPYVDVRYFYGPLSLYTLVGAFKVFGSSFTTAYAVGLVEAAAIVGVFYGLARQWLAPLAAALASAIVLAIGFSGTAFNFVLPHTSSATLGILAILGMLLALARGRWLAAGVLLGVVGLTRPELVIAAGLAGAAGLLGVWHVGGRRAALGAAWRLVVPGVVVPAVVLGGLAAWVGAHQLFFESLIPLDFMREGGMATQADWMPVSISGLAGLLGRGLIYGSLLAGLVASAERVRAEQGARRVVGLWPLVAAGTGLLVIDGLLRGAGLFAGQRAEIEEEIRHLVLGMSALPAIGIAAFLWAAWQWRRGAAAPLGRSWPADLALIVVAAALGARAYNVFHAEASYAPYYAPPLVLVLAILHERIGAERPAARVALLGALGAIACGLSLYALGGLYADQTTAVHTPRGTFVTTPEGARAIGGVVARIDQLTRPGERVLAAPAVAGISFMADRPPALPEVMLLPGLLADRADEEQAVRRLHDGHVRIAAIAARDFGEWDATRFGAPGFYPVLGADLRARTVRSERIGTLADPVGGTIPSHGYTILTLRP